MNVRDEIREKLPKWTRLAANGSRQCAIWLQCVECMGGSLRDAKTCEAKTTCFLWPHGLAAREVKRAAKAGEPSDAPNSLGKKPEPPETACGTSEAPEPGEGGHEPQRGPSC
jgi:hypothetical protein